MDTRLNTEPPAASNRCDDCLSETIEIAHRLIDLAEKGEAESADDGCAVLYGVVRDCAYRIRTEAERERTAHRGAGEWESER